jgi:hypothetical protein
MMASNKENKRRADHEKSTEEKNQGLCDMMTHERTTFKALLRFIDDDSICALIATDFNYELFLLDESERRSGRPQPARWR